MQRPSKNVQYAEKWGKCILLYFPVHSAGRIFSAIFGFAKEGWGWGVQTSLTPGVRWLRAPPHHLSQYQKGFPSLG